MPKLVVKSGNSSVAEFDLKTGVNTFGRGPLNDFRIEDPSVSSAHAEITVEPNCVTVKDLRSTNGTFINRSQIREAFLQPGQMLSFGAVEMQFVAEEAAAAAGPGAVARTIALPQVGGIKIYRPTAAPQHAGGMQMPANYPVPTAPAPNLTTAPTPLTPASVQPAPTMRQVPPQPRPLPAPVPVAAPAPVAAPPVEDRTWKHVPAPVRSEPGGLRCLGFGLGAAVVSGLLWIIIAATAGINPGPVALAVTGLICGLALRLASRGNAGAPYSLLAVGCALLGMFIGELGQSFAAQPISFAGLNLLALLGGLVCAALLGGFSIAPKTSRHSALA